MLKPNKITGMLSIFRPPLCFELTGRQFTLVFDDGYDRKLVFKDRKTISFGVEGEEKDFSYDCLKIADRCYFVNFEDPTIIPRTGITLMTASESLTVCIVTCAERRSPPRTTIARAFWMTQVSHTGTAGCTSSGFVSAAFFLAPQPASIMTATTHTNTILYRFIFTFHLSIFTFHLSISFRCCKISVFESSAAFCRAFRR